MGEGGVRGDLKSGRNPHPCPLPEYMERGKGVEKAHIISFRDSNAMGESTAILDYGCRSIRTGLPPNSRLKLDVTPVGVTITLPAL